MRQTWSRVAAGAGLATLLFAAWVAVRSFTFSQGLVPYLLDLLVVALLAGGAAALAAWTVRRTYVQAVTDLSAQVVALRDSPVGHPWHPATGERWADLGLAAVLEPVEALVAAYRKALAELVEAQENLERVRLLQERIGVEKGYSLSFVRRGGISRGSDRLVARLAPNCHWTAATPGLQRLLGHAMDELNARPFLDVVHPEDRPALARTFQEALKDGEAHNITFRVLPRVPETAAPQVVLERHLQMDVLTRYTNEGQPLHLRCHFVDITDQVRTDQELRRRSQALADTNARLRQINSDLQRLKESYRDLYHHSPALYFSLDPRGCFVACNETMLGQFGYSREELLGQAYVRILAPQTRAQFQQDPSAYWRANALEAAWVKKDGTVIDVSIHTTAPVQDAQGR